MPNDNVSTRDAEEQTINVCNNENILKNKIKILQKKLGKKNTEKNNLKNLVCDLRKN